MAPVDEKPKPRSTPKPPAAKAAPKLAAVAPAPPVETAPAEAPVATAEIAQPITEVEPAVLELTEIAAPVEAAPVVVATSGIAAEPTPAGPAAPETNTAALPVPTAPAAAFIVPQTVQKLVTLMTPTPTTSFKGFDNLSAFGKANIDALVQSNTAFAKGVEELSKEVLALTQSSLESAAAATKAIFAAKTVKDVVELNADYTKQSFEKLVANSTKIGELSVKLATATLAPLSSRVTSAVEKVAKPAA